MRRGAGTPTDPGEGSRPPGPRRRPGGRSAKVRGAVLDATFELAEQRGLAGFSVADIADRAGVHASSIYRRWGSREAVLVDALLTGVGRLAPTPDTGSLQADLRDYLRTSAAAMRGREGKLLVRLAVSMGDSPHSRRLRDDYWPRAIANASIMFERAIRRGELSDAVDTHAAVECLVAPLYLRVLLTGAGLDDAFLDGVIDVVLHGLEK